MRSDEPSRYTRRHEARFSRAGDVWIVAYEGRLLHLRDAKGLRYLALLLGNPRRPFHVAELRARADLRPLVSHDDDVERIRKAVTNRIRQSMARIETADAPLGLHLHNSVHTGTICFYTPETSLSWSTEVA